MRLLQKSLLLAYRMVRRMGLLDTKIGRTIFEHAYWTYKSLLEARDLRTLRPFVPDTSTVIDVGANIGYFTIAFARWVGAAGKVISIEPESRNFASLRKQAARRGVDDRIQFVRAVALDHQGMANLALTPDHPADHHVSNKGVPVPAVTVDSLFVNGDSPPVSFIKIDVQGSELRVLAGAEDTLRQARPALLVEFHEASLAAAGTSTAELMSFLIERNYIPQVRTRGSWRRIAPSELDRYLQVRGYVDVLFLHGSAVAQAGSR